MWTDQSTHYLFAKRRQERHGKENGESMFEALEQKFRRIMMKMNKSEAGHMFRDMSV